jgi:hypothetical protein
MNKQLMINVVLEIIFLLPYMNDDGGGMGGLALPLLGFGLGGITAGSVAASIQGPGVVAGSMFAVLQSLGATGMGILLFGSTGAAMDVLMMIQTSLLKTMRITTRTVNFFNCRHICHHLNKSRAIYLKYLVYGYSSGQDLGF